jgi:beta-lactamase superfamily II metal-dependent hydrolase
MTAEQVVVRMYNVGFGDCFLVTIPTDDGLRRILIDCGTHPASTGPRRASDAVKLLFEDLQAEAGKLRIDVVSVSHRHADHVSGFVSEQFADLEVGEVWMPWTENPNDPVATALRNKMKLAAQGLDNARAGITRTSPALDAAAAMMENNLELKNESAMQTLWSGFAGKPLRRYLSLGDDPLETPVLPGVKIHILGPSTDEKTIRDLEPPKKETFAHLGGEELAVPPPMPFDGEWAISFDKVKSDAAFKHLRVSGQVVGAIRALAADELFAAAAALTSSINGTSLMFILEVRGLLLFFPGDAQWGSWDRVLNDPKARDLLARCAFYKIGHHGSHNASPKSFIETIMAKDVMAAVPVAPVKVWPNIPQSDLVTAIKGRQVTVVQSDHPNEAMNLPNVTVRGIESIDFAFDLPAAPAT